jgi:asparagine synthase (glutamine-hydrolysing)
MFRDHLQNALESIDQPTFDGINTYFVSRAVREAGIKVALAGTGGDELFGGYRSFAELPRVRRAAAVCSAMPAGLVKAAARAVTRLQLGAAGDIPPQTRWGKLADVLTSGGRMLDAYQVGYGLFTREFLADVSPYSNGGTTRSGLPVSWAERLEQVIGGASDLAAISTLELSCFLGERLLRDTDAASMAVSLEVRVPLLDHEFIEAVGGLPDAERFAPLGRKQRLREIALGGLDPGTFDRPKAGFVLPLEVWCRESLHDDVAAAFADRALCDSVGLRSEVLTRLLGAFVKNAPGMYWSRVWSLYILLWWARQHKVTL